MAEGTADGVLTITINNPKNMIIEGYLTTNVESNPKNRETYYFFLGIPYAKPPVGDLRFQPPEDFEYDPDKHGRPFKASKGSLKAAQIEGKILVGEEDCLYLNVYVPKRQEISNPLAVLVYFHGSDDFSRGSGNYEDRTPDSIMRHGIILVTVNYRLGALGFLNLHIEECKGNAGLKDQRRALQWVRDNIAKFGGDPDNVTIGGESSGGSCVNFHLISPLSKGLFSKAIIQSGGIYSPWGFNGHQSEIVANYGRYHNFRAGQQELLVRKLMNDEARKALSVEFLESDEIPPVSCHVHIGPSMESFMTGAFLPYGIKELMEDADPVPILAGITAQDGFSIFEFGSSYKHHIDWISDDKKFRAFLCENLDWSDSVGKKHFEAIRNQYFPSLREITEVEIEKNLADLCRDLWFHRFYDNLKLGKGLKPPTPLYVYEFDFVSKLKEPMNFRKERPGAVPNNAIYLFYPAFARPFSPEIQKVVTTMCSLWANFCKTGEPKCSTLEVDWIPHTDDDPHYLYIGEQLLVKNGWLNQERWKFLNVRVKEEERIKELTSDPKTWDLPSALRMLLQDLRSIFRKLRPKISSQPAESVISGPSPSDT